MITQPLVSEIPLEPDVPLAPAPDRPPTATPLDATAPEPSDGGIFSGLVEAISGASQSLEHAQGAENAFAAGNGDLQTMVFERARADSMLSVASAAATKAVQSLNTVLNMQV